MEQHEEVERKLLPPPPPVIFRLFGVEVCGGGGGGGVDEEYEDEEVDGFLKKSSSMPNLTSIGPPADGGKRRASDDSELASRQQKRSRRRKVQERKKGIPWTEEEHKKFLDGLRQLGKGDWRGISKNFVATRTATQVASHAQKYFLRQINPGKKKRRASLFDVVAEYNDDQLPSPQSVGTKPAPTQEIIHTDRGDVPIPSYPVARGFRGDSVQVDELTEFVKKSKATEEMSLSMISGLEMASSSISSLELSIAPPHGVIEAIKVL
ncbi:hypothetical protein E2562_006158 [Oryza meyeriana var. granulata]|uniref:Uncharacterized protein n=1 Tax=Oryza meyeriana var. granulata TaxID=110450 RepID=A0A6G1EVX6_9ORYZ|nr:hypothetical protein E2562_006158 [Oryza meyeriana var. granulata]